MDIELVEILDFLTGHRPFDLLPKEILADLPARMETIYARRGTTVIEPGENCVFLYIVRTGAVETHAPDGQLLARLGEGEAFGVLGLLGDGIAVNRVVAIEDTLLYLLPAREFERLRREFAPFAFFFSPAGGDRLRGAREHGQHGSDQIGLMSVRAGELLTREPVTVAPEESIREAAARMRAYGVSCLLVTARERLVGIITDRDLRNRVLAEGMSYDAPLSGAMTPDPITMDADSLVFDVLLTMTQRTISHLPITRSGRLAGVITNTNLVRRQTLSAVHLAGDIYKRRTAEGLAQVVAQIPQVLVHLVDVGATAHNIGHIVTSLTDATTIRLLQLAEEQLGPPPVPYLWLAAGSQARHEQSGVSDQDNCMIIDDAFVEAEHGAYFEALARFVCDGLNECGYVYCPGEMMATTPKWRQPLAQWRRYFSTWIEEPEPMALMLSSVFFDLRPVHGDFRLYTDLQEMILAKARGNRIFLGLMVTNALTHTAPLGFFRNFVLIRGGEHDAQLDLKHNGTVPIVDIARIYALDAGIKAVNTQDRLEAERAGSALSPAGAFDLLDSFEFIAITRLIHQARQIRAGEKPDNFMPPDELSEFERSHLKDAFSVIKTIQSALASAYQTGAR